MSEAGVVPIRESVGAALRFVRENARFIALAALAGAAATTLLGALSLGVPAIAMINGAASGFVQAVVYASFVGAFLFGAGAAPARLAGDAWRVWAAMVIVGFFLFIVFVVASIPAIIMLAVGPLAPYISDLQAAGEDQAAVMAVMTRFAQENPGPLLAVALAATAVWFFLTSRLYLAAPASADQGRILSFETWAWTKGAALRIIAARLLLLFPANILVSALDFLVGRLLGVNVLAPAADSVGNPATFLGYLFVASFLTFAVYSALEAGLSAYLYRGLKPETPPPADIAAS